MGFRLIGHRGARNEAPENTLAGFAHARALGLDAIELDLRQTRDGQIVVIHDATVDRTTNGEGSVADLTLADLRALDARSVHPAWPNPVTIPTLDEVLHWAGPTGMFLQIEIKADSLDRMAATIDEAVRQVTRWNMAGRVLFSSFDADAITWLRDRHPAWPRAYVGGFHEPVDLEMAVGLGCEQIDVSLQHGRQDVVAEAHARGLRVIGWQCNTPEHVAEALAWGIDGATSDAPQTVMPLLRAAGAFEAKAPS
ncbi:MAG TPA: glycerophosphodiester phosphodiesterase family protein [Thermomicrobiales bacterium]|nr:glycerophosphodiester phosphodiesterase family protein [Thermomicrobiales bacterium]